MGDWGPQNLAICCPQSHLSQNKQAAEELQWALKLVMVSCGLPLKQLTAAQLGEKVGVSGTEVSTWTQNLSLVSFGVNFQF